MEEGGDEKSVGRSERGSQIENGEQDVRQLSMRKREKKSVVAWPY